MNHERGRTFSQYVGIRAYWHVTDFDRDEAV